MSAPSSSTSIGRAGSIRTGIARDDWLDAAALPHLRDTVARSWVGRRGGLRIGDFSQRVRRDAARVFAVRFRPGADTALALATAVAFWFVYYLGARTPSPLAFLLFTVLGTGLLCVILPAYYMLVIRKEPLANLGITKRRWVLALALSAFFAAGSLPQLLAVAANEPDVDLTAHLLGNGLVFWEPFFVYGWLQLRFERAFGIVPGIVLAALCFAGYHLGTFPLAAVAGFIVVGLLQGALFRAVGANLLVVWPLMATVGSAIGTLQGGFVFGWDSVPEAVALLIVQLAAIAVFARWPGRRTERSGAATP